MIIQHNINLSIGTKQYIQRNINVSLFNDNHRLYEVGVLLRVLNPKELIGVDKNDLKVLNNLLHSGTTYITI
jgi:hypothetical protein